MLSLFDLLGPVWMQPCHTGHVASIHHGHDPVFYTQLAVKKKIYIVIGKVKRDSCSRNYCVSCPSTTGCLLPLKGYIYFINMEYNSMLLNTMTQTVDPLTRPHQSVVNGNSQWAVFIKHFTGLLIT